MEGLYRKVKSKFYSMANIASVAGFFIGGAMQVSGVNANNDKLVEAGLYTTILSGGYFLGRKLAEKQFKKASGLEDRL